MSNISTPLRLNISKNYIQKIPDFNQYLSNLVTISSKGYPYMTFKDNSNKLSQKNIEKYIKLNGSKSIILSNMNSFITKRDLNPENDYTKLIKDNLPFISANSKYITKIPIFSKFNNYFNINNNTINNFNTNKIEININNNINNNDINNKSINIALNNQINMNKNNDTNMPKIFNQSNPNDNNIINKFNSQNLLNESQTQYRQDYYIKQFKVQYSIWLRNILNKLLTSFLQKVKLNNKKFIKFYPLNSLHFTANPKYKDNKIFLKLKIKDILIIGIDSNKNSNQKKNKENIEFIEKIGETQNNAKELINFLNMTMEESISIFYKSEQFYKFKNSAQAQINDNKFYNEKKFSLLEDNGFIFLIKNFNGNVK